MFTVELNDKQAEIIEALLRSYIEDSKNTEEPIGNVNAATNAFEKVVKARVGLQAFDTAHPKSVSRDEELTTYEIHNKTFTSRVRH